MRRRAIVTVAALVLAGVVLSSMASRQPWRHGVAALSPNLEDRLPDGAPYNPSTQSFLRGHHWLDSVERIEIAVDRDGVARLDLRSGADGYRMGIRGLALDQIVPRLHYRPASPPDAFDAYNLMLAEFARNSLSVPVGKPGDRMAHFETDLEEAVPWTLEGDYRFVPNPLVRPVRMSVINNCLAPGLWELSAADRTGEIYHAWFDMPGDLYYGLVAETNGVSEAFVAEALGWSDRPVPLDLGRLRTVVASVGRTAGTLVVDEPVGFSSQDSRRKLHKHYVEVGEQGAWRSPGRLGELTAGTCRFSNFVAPGKYALADRKPFDFRFLRDVRGVDVIRVRPLTDYGWRRHRGRAAPSPHAESECLELQFDLGDHVVVIGNLLMPLLVPQEDYVLNGFGVGILDSGGLAERRRYLIEQGPPPSHAYLCRREGDGLIGLNSHDFGIEQIFVRTHSDAAEPWWEITITSYERIVDIVKYRVIIPESLRRPLRQHALAYISPLYRTYRDDNLR